MKRKRPTLKDLDRLEATYNRILAETKIRCAKTLRQFARADIDRSLRLGLAVFFERS